MSYFYNLELPSCLANYLCWSRNIQITTYKMPMIQDIYIFDQVQNLNLLKIFFLFFIFNVLCSSQTLTLQMVILCHNAKQNKCTHAFTICKDVWFSFTGHVATNVLSQITSYMVIDGNFGTWWHITHCPLCFIVNLLLLYYYYYLIKQ